MKPKLLLYAWGMCVWCVVCVYGVCVYGVFVYCMCIVCVCVCVCATPPSSTLTPHHQHTHLTPHTPTHSLTEEQIVLHGLPIRPEFSARGGNKNSIRSKLGLLHNKPTVLLIGM